MKKVNRVGSEMSDEVLLGYLKPVKVEEISKRAGRSGSDLFPRLVKLFVASGTDAMDVDYKAMGRKWSAVAQSLRVALKDTPAENGEPLSSVAYVSVNKADQTILLRKKDPNTPTGPGRPPKKSK